MTLDFTDLDDRIRRIALAGRLDVGGVDAVETPFTAAAVGSGRHVAVDMSDVGFIASLGLRMFVAVARAVQRDGRRIVLYACQPPVAEVLEMAALDDLFQVLPTEGAARVALS
jgi:anti-anti-sigma factor